jgi:hypothetical protein
VSDFDGFEENRETRMPKDDHGPVVPPPAEPKVIKTTEHVPPELERVTEYWDRAKVDREWLLRRAGKKK